MEFYPAIFCDDEVHKGAKCINCGLSVTHIFDWQNTEIQEEENQITFTDYSCEIDNCKNHGYDENSNPCDECHIAYDKVKGVAYCVNFVDILDDEEKTK